MMITVALLVLLCTPPNPQAPIPPGGTLFTESIDFSTAPPTHTTEWLCQDYTVHTTIGPVSEHYVCTARDTCPPPRRRTVSSAGAVAPAHVRLTKD